MNFDNNATRTRRDLLIRIARLAYENDLVNNVDRIPLEIRPKNDRPLRCCIYKDRAVLRYRIMANLGRRIEEEEDELTPLSKYAQDCIDNKIETQKPILTVIDEACSSCVQSKYFVTNACRGCVARPCMINCPKKAITIGDQGQAQINSELCVNCGICQKACPYHSIIRIPVPCEEACPVKAIHKNENGKVLIDYDKCILCGRCMQECPFGAIMEWSQMVNLITAIKSGKKVIAMIAPAAIGQFGSELGQLITALKTIGFCDVIEVAFGAEKTAKSEAAELEHKIANGEQFMTSSCCPSFVLAVKNHLPALKEKISTTPTPLHFTAEHIAQKYPDALRVFVSPCVAKKQEAQGDELINMVITCEELGAMFAANNIDVGQLECASVESKDLKNGRNFPMIGGVAGAVKAYLNDPDQLKLQLINGLTRQNIKLLKSYGSKGIPGCNFLEVMACTGGCVNGPCTLENSMQAIKQIKKLTE